MVWSFGLNQVKAWLKCLFNNDNPLVVSSLVDVLCNDDVVATGELTTLLGLVVGDFLRTFDIFEKLDHFLKKKIRILLYLCEKNR